MADRMEVYTDGACLGNPGPGGWAWAVPGGRYASGAAERSTNQRMEIQAALEAVLAHTEPIEIVSDSTYVVHCFRDRWWEGWMRRGWKNAKKEPVANRDLWEPLVEAVKQGDVTFRWVKGHSGDPHNDLVDALAVDAARNQEGRRGTGTPDIDFEALAKAQPGGAGPAPSSASGSAAPGAWRGPGVAPPEGHRMVAGGLRAADLGGFDETDLTSALRRRLSELFAAKAAMHDDLLVVSGLSLGSETIAAEAALDAGVGLVAVVPFPDFDRRWSDQARTRYSELLGKAAHVVQLERKVPDGTQKFQAAMRRRDAWLVRAAHEAVVVWDHHDGLTQRFIKSLSDHLDETDIWIQDPHELPR